MLDVGNVFILGDSYSTFENHIPEGYTAWYSEQKKEETDVCRVEEMWWYGFLNETKSNLLLNSSYSGMTICNTGYNGVDNTLRSFIDRLDSLIENGYFKDNRVDTFIVFGGTNDSWLDAPVGELMYSGWKREDLYFALPAVCYLLYRIKTYIPDARLLFILNTELKKQIAEGYKTACREYGGKYA